MPNCIDSVTGFFDQKLLQTDYLLRHRRAYEEHPPYLPPNPYRCFPAILNALQTIANYRLEHAKSFAKRIKASDGDFRSCEGIVSEIIVYVHYIPLVKQRVVKSLDICKDDYDLRIERAGLPDVFLEVLCIMPENEADANGVYTVKSILPTGVRQKLLDKLTKQRQMRKDRENWAVIELNDIGIAGEFTVRSSLSDGYKLTFGLGSNRVIASGFDWTQSLFDAPETRNLHGVIDFDLGNYAERRYIVNGRVRGDVGDGRTLRIP